MTTAAPLHDADRAAALERADRLIALVDGVVTYDGAPGDTDVNQLVFHT